MPDKDPHGLTASETERYERQILLPEFGPDGQAKLARSSVLVVGAGGLGSAALLYLAAAGIGRIGIVDSDRVTLGNLHRQVLHDTAGVGDLKTGSARRHLAALNPLVRLDEFPVRFTGDEASLIAEGYDLLVDATDNIETRLLINRICIRRQKPMVYGSAQGWEGQFAVFDSARGPCYRCLFPPKGEPARTELPAKTGVIGPLPGIIGSLEALEAIKFLLGLGGDSIGRLTVFEGITSEWSSIRLQKNPRCPACGGQSSAVSHSEPRRGEESVSNGTILERWD